MFELSTAGLIGAVLGIAVAAFAYAPILSCIERHLQPRAGPGSGAEGKRVQQADHPLSLLPRLVLACDMLFFAGLGYWLAAMLAG